MDVSSNWAIIPFSGHTNNPDFFQVQSIFSKLVLSALKRQTPELNDVWCFPSEVKDSRQN